MTAEGQVLVGHLEPVDDLDLAPRQVGLERHGRVTVERPTNAAASLGDPVVEGLRIEVPKGARRADVAEASSEGERLHHDHRAGRGSP